MLSLVVVNKDTFGTTVTTDYFFYLLSVMCNIDSIDFDTDKT
jgi:hypothetical protein